MQGVGRGAVGDVHSIGYRGVRVRDGLGLWPRGIIQERRGVRKCAGPAATHLPLDVDDKCHVL